jgi:hypothetical protein
MAFLGGLALLGSAGEAYQSAKSKQYALDEAALDQEASKAIGSIGPQLAQLAAQALRRAKHQLRQVRAQQHPSPEEARRSRSAGDGPMTDQSAPSQAGL